jgi:hypothetical protein
MICPVCSLVVTMANDHVLVPVDIPYMNLLYHLKCWRTIKDDPKLNDILHIHVKICYNGSKDGNNNGKKEKNTQLDAVQGNVRRRV